MNNFLITRPNHDVTTNYLYHWAGLVIKEAQKKNFSIVDLKGKRANQKELTNIIKKINPSLIFFNGHGDDYLVAGYDDQILVRSNENEFLLKGKIVYALSCRSASGLGRDCIKTGTKAYLGYKEDFIFMFDKGCVSRPLSDKIATYFLAPSNHLIISLLKNNTAGQAYKKSQQTFKKSIKKLLTSESPQDDKMIIPYLVWDMNCQVYIGDQGAKI